MTSPASGNGAGGWHEGPMSQWPPPLPGRWQPRPRLERNPEDAWLAGVASGIARHLGWPVGLVRAGFIILTLFNFLGLIVYGVLWVLIPEPGARRESPGLEAAERAGMRSATRMKLSRNWGALPALLVLGFGLSWLVQATGWGVSRALFWPMALACIGIALVWVQADQVDDDLSDAPRWSRPLLSRRTWPSAARIVIGVGLMGTAVSIVAASTIGFSQLSAVLLIAALIVLSLVVLLAPWAHRVRSSLAQAREETLLADARADMAAHLHDSVLQTLALIQRQADDPKAVATLARRQERELRTWLYGETQTAAMFKAALAQAGAAVEDERGVPVEVVCVGDTELNADLEAMIKAARESVLNAAKHSGASAIDVYAEVADDRVEIFVRDRGKGFDPDLIADDRMGVKRSIIDRMERHGGTATIRSAPGEGTEVRLEMKR